MKNIQKLLVLASLTGAACTIRPTVTFKPDGSVVATTGASLMTKSKMATAQIKLPNGTELAYSEEGKDETVVPVLGIKTWGTVETVLGLAKEANVGESLRERGQTARVVSDNNVKKADIAAEQAVKTFVPPIP
jgi:hypothetical protein